MNKVYIDADKLLNSDTPGLNEVLGSPNILDTLMQINLGPEGMFLLLINVAVYVCGFVALLFDMTVILTTKKHKSYDKDRKELFKVKKTFDDKIASIDKKQSDLHTKIKQNREIAEETLHEIDKELNELNYLCLIFKIRSMIYLMKK